MRIILTAAIVLLTASGAASEPYLWTLSASSTDPFVNTGAPTSGLFELHLWLACSSLGMSAAKFEWQQSGLQLLAFIPCCGFFTGENPQACFLLAVGGCPGGPARTGFFLVLDPGLGGRVCFEVCPELEGTVDCDPNPTVHPYAWIGFASDGGAACAQGSCGPISVDESSWGGIKGTYR